MKRKRHHWTREDWDEAVRICGNASTMEKYNYSLLQYGQRRGWNKSTVWPNEKRHRWTREDWDEAVRLYGCPSIMEKNNNALWQFGCRRGWHESTVWPNKKRHRWTRKEWDEAVQLHGNAFTMKKENPRLYDYGCRHGWAKTTKWPNRLTRRGYSEEQLKKEVFESSRRFHSRGEFQKNDHRNYWVAANRGWLDEMYWLGSKENPFTDRINYIYLYLFEEQKTFYVGETFHGSQRHNEHLRRGPVFEFARNNGIEVPEPIILEDNLNRLNEVRRQEDYWKLHYISLGYATLNKGKTGERCGSLGSASMKWTRKKCYEAASQCSTPTEFYKKFRGAYQAARQHGWWKDYTWFVIVSGKPRQVLQYTKDGRLVGKWDSLRSAAAAVSGKHPNISHCCRGVIKSAYGFVWKYAE